MKPVIGIVASWNEENESSVLPHTYVSAVLEAGGIPLAIPMVGKEEADQILPKLDGMVFPGGADVDPARYGECPHLKLGKVNPRLDELELYLARRVLDMGLPVVGICRGCQVVNVAAGGTLVQDIPSQVGGAMKHQQQAPRWHGTHEVIIDEDSLAFDVFGVRRLMVNSYHHQAVRDPGEGLVVSGRALDGVTEVVEGRKNFVLLIQWHPECMFKHNRVFLRPFEALVEAARNYRD